ncbi:DUF927 domain-containing protein [Bacillus sp. N3536]|nr:DUF927 domain-containing protein [Bacillus sp. N3536]
MTIFADTFGYHCNHKGLYRKEIDEVSGIVSHKYIARPIYIKEIIRVLDTEEVFFKVRFLFNDGWQEQIIERQKVVERDITLLLKTGADVGGWKTKMLVNYLYEAESKAPMTYQHKFLGWHQYKDKYFYAHTKLSMPINSLQSQYIGNFKLAKKGQKRKWEQAIRNYVVGHKELELALCMGFSAMLVGYINQRLSRMDSLIFHIGGNSTIGKSTAVSVAVAGFGDPSEDPQSLVQSFNGTENALISLISKNNGVPLVFDETSLSLLPTAKLTNLIYSWAKNVDKARADKNGDVRKRSGWATSIITTGEGSVVNQLNQNEGLRARMFEFNNLQWTKSANHSESLFEALSMNYGHGVQPFINYLNTYLPNEIKREWKIEISKITSLFPESKFKNRIGNKFGLVTLTAKIINEVFDFGLDVEAIRSLLVAQEQESLEERAIGPKAYEHLREWLLTNNGKFYMNKVQEPAGAVWGKIDVDRKKGETTAFILPKQFERFLAEYGYSDESVVLRELNDLGKLVTEKNKYYARRVIRGEPNRKNGVKVFAIILEGMPIFVPISKAEVQSTPRKAVRGKRKSKTIDTSLNTTTYEAVDIDDM